MHIKKLILLSLAFLFYSCLPLKIQNNVDINENEDWLYIGGSPGNTNISKSKNILNPPFKLFWEFDADGGLGKNCLSASDAILFATTLNGDFFAIDITSGKNLGRVSTTGKSSFSTPLIYSNEIIITSSGDSKSRLFSYNITSGKTQWQRNVGWVESSPVLNGDDFFVSSLNGKIYKINAQRGNIIWFTKPEKSKNISAAFYTSPVIYDNKIFIGNISGNLYAFDASSGKELWSFKTEGSIYCDAAVKDSRIYFGSDDKNFYCIDTSGNLIWKKNLNTKFLSSSTFYNETVIITGIDGNVYALDTATSEIKWTFSTRGAIWASPLLQGDKLFFGSMDKYFYCILAENGKELWKYLCEGRVKTSAVIWKEYIFVASDEKYIYCFK